MIGYEAGASCGTTCIAPLGPGPLGPGPGQEAEGRPGTGGLGGGAPQQVPWPGQGPMRNVWGLYKEYIGNI